MKYARFEVYIRIQNSRNHKLPKPDCKAQEIAVALKLAASYSKALSSWSLV